MQHACECGLYLSSYYVEAVVCHVWPSHVTWATHFMLVEFSPRVELEGAASPTQCDLTCRSRPIHIIRNFCWSWLVIYILNSKDHMYQLPHHRVESNTCPTDPNGKLQGSKYHMSSNYLFFLWNHMAHASPTGWEITTYIVHAPIFCHSASVFEHTVSHVWMANAFLNHLICDKIIQMEKQNNEGLVGCLPATLESAEMHPQN